MIGFDSFEHFGRTDVGVRRSHNQDAMAEVLAGDATRFAEHGHVFIVADGMGGHAVGEKASAKAVRDIPHLVMKYAPEGAAQALRKAVSEANAGIFSIGQENPEFRGMGTTATTLWLRPEGAWIAHVGDSRAYRLRGGVIEQLTFDHSAVWEIARRQGMRPEELQGVRSNVILRSLGPEPTVEVDVEGPHPLQPGDTFLICSDGLTGQLSNYEIGAILSVLPPEEACDFLVELTNLRGAPDNVTVLIVRVKGEPAALPAATTAVNAAKPTRPLKRGEFQWPLPTMLGGIALALTALVMVALDTPGREAVFGLAALCVAVGLVGLLAMSRRLNREPAEPEYEPRLQVYDRERCQIEPSLLDKMIQAEEAVRERLPEEGRAAALTEVQGQLDEAAASRQAGDLPRAFLAHCRAMHSLVRRFNRLRNKEEVFSPVWDKHR